jgi:AcrR family transcriptional regulator
MSKIKTEAWIKAGYKILGKEGIEGIKVERLARILQLNKSGFYHYFGSMNIFLQRVLRYHVSEAKIVALEVGGCASLDPDLLLLIIKYKTFFLVESQLLVKCKPSQFASDLDEASKIVNKEILPLWRTATRLPEDMTAALAYLNIIHHFFYARINADKMSYEVLQSLAIETKEVLNKVVDEKHIDSDRPGSNAPHTSHPS